MDDKLQLYYEDIDNIFEITKQELGYDDFTVTAKKIFEPTIQKCILESKKLIKPIVWETERAVLLLADIEKQAKRMFVNLRINNENYKSLIYTMSMRSSSEIDSIVPHSFNSKDWNFVINLEE